MNNNKWLANYESNMGIEFKRRLDGSIYYRVIKRPEKGQFIVVEGNVSCNVATRSHSNDQVTPVTRQRKNKWTGDTGVDSKSKRSLTVGSRKNYQALLPNNNAAVLIKEADQNSVLDKTNTSIKKVNR